MKYVMFIYQAPNFDPKKLSQDDYKAVAEGYAAINGTAGVKPGVPLGVTADAITVRLANGKPVSSRGPHVTQPGGAVGGFLEFEAESDEAAIALASRIPAVAQGGAVEIRPSKVYW